MLQTVVFVELYQVDETAKLKWQLPDFALFQAIFGRVDLELIGVEFESLALTARCPGRQNILKLVSYVVVFFAFSIVPVTHHPF